MGCNGDSNCKMAFIIDQPKIINLPKIFDKRGNLSFFENDNQIPFVIKRSYWIYDVPSGECPDGFACKTNKEFIVALSGSFDVVLDNGKEKTVYHLNRSCYGLYVPEMNWREMENFSTNSLALVVVSTNYDPNDYIRDYTEYLEKKNNAG